MSTLTNYLPLSLYGLYAFRLRCFLSFCVNKPRILPTYPPLTHTHTHTHTQRTCVQSTSHVAADPLLIYPSHIHQDSQMALTRGGQLDETRCSTLEGNLWNSRIFTYQVKPYGSNTAHCLTERRQCVLLTTEGTDVCSEIHKYINKIKYFFFLFMASCGTRWRSWLRHYATSRQVDSRWDHWDLSLT
jgi:hypothetical protein